MSSVLNRSTKEFRASVNTPDFPVEDWIINPDMTAVSSELDKRKWIIAGDIVSLASTAEIDAQIEVYREEKLEQLAQAVEVFGANYYPSQTENRLKILYSQALSDGLTNRAAKIGEALTWESALTTEYMTRRAAVKAATSVSSIEAVSLGFSAYAPNSIVTVPDALEITD